MLPSSADLPERLSHYAHGLDHVAIAVADLEESIVWYRDVLGFQLTERRETKGKKTGMVSAVMVAKDIDFVLLQGTTPDSQVTRFLNSFGQGVQHIAIRVENLEDLVAELQDSDIEFDTSIIKSPGLRQIFLKRHPKSGLMIELIERLDEEATFSDEGVQQLFDQLEQNDSY